jgi:hypothetical protein
MQLGCGACNLTGYPPVVTQGTANTRGIG